MNKKKIITTFFCLCTIIMQAQQQNATISLNIEANKYLFGLGVEKDEQKAFALYLQSATNGDVQAMNKVGVFYKEAIGTVANKTKAIYWLNKACDNGFAKAYYNLGSIYKDAEGVEQDFSKAFEYFSKGTTAKDPLSIYAKGYLLYKGFGCVQNYQQAAQHFLQAANAGKSTAMYYLGLSYRNGYGVVKNTDTAKLWLQKALAKGEIMAMQELGSTQPENNNQQLTAFAESLKNKISKTPKTEVNQVVKIESSIGANIIEGKYRGYILKYDWSNKYVIAKSLLNIELNYNNGELTGKWIDNDSTLPFKAMLTSNDILFKNTSYERTSHYNPNTPIQYSFQNAKLQWQTIDDSLTLNGTIQMWNNYTNEPHNVQYIYLTKYQGSNNPQQIRLINDDGTQMKSITNLTVHPNPFNNVVNVEFENKETQKVQISLLNVDGKILYANDLGILKRGAYSIAIKPNQNIVSGVYIIKMQYNTQIKTIKLVKQ
jgi:uncharacterized protein